MNRTLNTSSSSLTDTHASWMRHALMAVSSLFIAFSMPMLAADSTAVKSPKPATSTTSSSLSSTSSLSATASTSSASSAATTPSSVSSVQVTPAPTPLPVVEPDPLANLVIVDGAGLEDCVACLAGDPKGEGLCEDTCGTATPEEVGSFIRVLCWFFSGGDPLAEKACVDFFEGNSADPGDLEQADEASPAEGLDDGLAQPALEEDEALLSQLGSDMTLYLDEINACSECMSSGKGQEGLCQADCGTATPAEASTFDRVLCWFFNSGDPLMEKTCVEFHSQH